MRQIVLTNDEALVLFEWLAARAGGDEIDAPLSAEEIVLARVHGQLETALTEPFDPKYKDLLAAARSRVQASPCPSSTMGGLSVHSTANGGNGSTRPLPDCGHRSEDGPWQTSDKARPMSRP